MTKNNKGQDTSRLEQVIGAQFRLDLQSDHGLSHWRRVKEIGTYLSHQTNADIHVVKAFALLHDAKREDEYHDPEHGKRGSAFAKELFRKGLLQLTKQQLNQLMFACEYHSDRAVKTSDITIQTCWDSDRPDLWRVGIVPDPKFLHTEAARKEESRMFSLELFQNPLPIKDAHRFVSARRSRLSSVDYR